MMFDGLWRSSADTIIKAAGAECSIEPVGIAQSSRELVQPIADASRDQGFASPVRVALDAWARAVEPASR